MAPHAMTPPNGTVNGPVDSHTPPPPAVQAKPTPTAIDVGDNTFDPIAICGMACRLPGGINSPSELWDFLITKGDAKGRVPSSRYGADTYLADNGKPGSINCPYGYFLGNDLGAIDGSFFTMSPKELERCDPQQRLMLEVAREVLEDAGETNWRGKQIGVYMGNFGEDWLGMLERDTQSYSVYSLTGAVDFNLSNRISYEMDLQGPSVTVRTACSASLVALNQACLAITQGQCKSAIVGGTNLILTPSNTTKFVEMGVMAPDGSCKAFSADCNGYARGEAINAVYVKSLKDAVRDGNPIRAVIRATCVNNDGKTPGFTFPSTWVQEKLIRNTYGLAGITDMSKTAFVECHGTGTPAGDPVETQAVGRVFGENGVYIGSVKPNLGHAEGASGLTSVLKAVLALENRTIPPNIKFTSPNPNIPWDEAKLRVPLEPTPWPENRDERVSVNSFGIGGTNAYIILDSAAQHNVELKLEDGTDAPHLLVFSANSPESLYHVGKLHTEYLAKNPGRISDLAFTLSQRREQLPYKSFVVASREQPGAVSVGVKQQQQPQLGFVFTGQGAQWPTMGRDLLRNNTEFRDSIKSMDRHLRTLGPHAPEWTIEAELRKPAKTSRLANAELSQPLCTAIQVGLVDALSKVGVTCDAVVGHSSGEIAGAYASGALTAEEAITVAYYRGIIASKQTKQGAMAAIGLGWDQATQYLQLGVAIACDNSPRSVTLSGDKENVEAVVDSIKTDRPDVLARLLQVDKAYHSWHMKEVGELYTDMVGDKVQGKTPLKPFFSTVHGKLLPEGELLGPHYWQQNLESPVRFRSAVSNILQHPTWSKNIVFVEIGPHSALAGPLRQIAAEVSSNALTYVNTMVRGGNCTEALLAAIGRLWALRVAVNFGGLYPAEEHVTVHGLPRYPWNHTTTHWSESRVTKEWRFPRHAHHDLLGSKTIESSDLEPVWRNNFILANTAWIRDHKIQDDIVFPFAGYIAIAAEAIRQASGAEDGFQVRNFRVRTAMVVSDESATEIITTLRKKRISGTADSQWWEFSITSHNGQAWTKHAVGEISALSHGLGSATERMAELPRSLPSNKWYDAIREAGIDYGSHFRGLENIRTSTTDPGLASAHIQSNRQSDGRNYHVHPTIVDAILQLLACSASLGLVRKSKEVLATSIKELTVVRTSANVEVSASASFVGRGSVLGNAEAVDDAGNVVLRLKGAKLALLAEPVPANTHAAARQIWKPHVDFIPVDKMLAPAFDYGSQASVLDEIYKLSLLALLPELAAVETSVPHLRKHKDWIVAQAALYAPTNDQPLEQLQSRLQHLSNNLRDSPAHAVALAIAKVSSAIVDIFKGTRDASSVLEEDDVSNQLHEFTDMYDRSTFFTNLAHTNPNLRVLQLCSRSGSTAEGILKHITPLYMGYTLSDTSTSLFESAKEKLEAYGNVEYTTLHIGQDLNEQGFDAKDGYDVVIAINALHQTDNIQDALKNIQKLLRPKGKLLLQNLNPASAKWINFVRGIQQGWWKEAEEGQMQDPILDASAWQTELEAAGFDASNSIVNEHHLSSVFVASAKINMAAGKQVAILTNHSTTNIDSIVAKLKEQDYKVSRITLDDTPAPGIDILSLLDVESPFFHDIQESDFNRFKMFAERIVDAGLLWITHLSPLQAKDPRYAQVLGLARVMRNETGLHFAVGLSGDETTPGWYEDGKIVDVLRHFQQRSDDGRFAPEMEYAIHENSVKVCRFHPLTLTDLLLSSHDGDCITLEASRVGRQVDLQWTSQKTSQLVNDQVEVSVHAASLTSKDVQIATGVIDTASSLLGQEAVGVVNRVGPDVQTLGVGDRVLVLSRAALATTVTDSEQHMAKIPHDMAYNDAVMLPLAFSVAAYSLLNIGQIERDQTILIHNAASVIGLAALQIARDAGADIFVTADSDDDAVLLSNVWNVAKERIFSSKDVLFKADIMQRTAGRGFDIVLNSLAGELAQESWQMVSEFGKFVDISSSFGSASVDKFELDLSTQNRSLHYVDFDRLHKERPIIINRLLRFLSKLCAEQKILHIAPLGAYKADEVMEAFHLVQQRPGGNAVVELRDANGKMTIGTDIAKKRKAPKFDSHASYILVGGLGGIGRSTAVWLVENGARNLVFLGRSTGKPEDVAFAHELETMGATAKMIKGSVTDERDVSRVIEAALALGPLKGIVNMTMVLHDGAWVNMNWNDWQAAISPKVQGTWHLHNQSIAAGAELDFFVLFSSISNLIGNVGQSNYASANSFLDAFAQY
ncbi:Type I Iterative PKS, partial [Arthroderma sp. PD_2]